MEETENSSVAILRNEGKRLDSKWNYGAADGEFDTGLKIAVDTHLEGTLIVHWMRQTQSSNAVQQKAHRDMAPAIMMFLLHWSICQCALWLLTHDIKGYGILVPAGHEQNSMVRFRRDTWAPLSSSAM
jgi:hypothetical protein